MVPDVLPDIVSLASPSFPAAAFLVSLCPAIEPSLSFLDSERYRAPPEVTLSRQAEQGVRPGRVVQGGRGQVAVVLAICPVWTATLSRGAVGYRIMLIRLPFWKDKERDFRGFEPRREKLFCAVENHVSLKLFLVLSCEQSNCSFSAECAFYLVNLPFVFFLFPAKVAMQMSASIDF
jgi:hypothetical protein